MTPELKPHNQALKLKYGNPVSSCAFNFNLLRYTPGLHPERRRGAAGRRVRFRVGGALQLDPMLTPC